MKKHTLLIVIAVIISSFFFFQSPLVGTNSAATAVAPGSPRLAELLGSDLTEGYASVREKRRFVFPDDHGAHPDYRNEWWYLTGNLDGEDGERFGFELTIFRIAVAPEGDSGGASWRSNQVYMGHFAVTDAGAEKFHVVQRFSRGSLGLAGAQAEPFRIWLEDWELVEMTDENPGTASSTNVTTPHWRLRANDQAFGIDLLLTALKLPVLNGDEGLSQKSAKPGNASYYYSIPRLQTSGSLRIGDNLYNVSGLSWLDREWGSGALSDEQLGWDWFALQLSDGSELMYYDLRRADGAPDPHSAGTFVSRSGNVKALSRDDVTVDVLDYWQSADGVRYPMAWRLSVESLGLSAKIAPVMRNQELSGLVRYWEGAVDVTGESEDAGRITGRGYVELTGYAGTLSAATNISTKGSSE